MAYNAFTAPISLRLALDAYPTQPFRGWDDLDHHPVPPTFLTILNATPSTNQHHTGSAAGSNDNEYFRGLDHNGVYHYLTSTSAADKHPLFLPTINKLRAHILSMSSGSTVVNEEQYRRLYVGNLDPSVTKDILLEIFKSFGPIETIEVHAPRNQMQSNMSSASPGFAFIQYDRIGSVFDALICMNVFKIRGRNLRVSYTESIKKLVVSELPTPQQCELFMKTNLGQFGIDGRTKWRRAVEVGITLGLIGDEGAAILDQYGSSRQYGILTESEAKEIISGQFGTNTSADQGPPQQTKIFVGGNFGQEVGESQLYEIFSSFGAITKITLIPGNNGGHKGYGFIDFVDEETAERACTLNGFDLGSKRLTVSLAKATASTSASRFRNNLTANQQLALTYNNVNLDDHLGGRGDGSGRRGGDGESMNDINNPDLSSYLSPHSAMIPFEYDYNSLTIPDPLATRYPAITPVKNELNFYPCVKITNLVDVAEWVNEMDDQQRDEFTQRLVKDFAVFGLIIQNKDPATTTTTPNSSTSNNYIMVVDEDDIVSYGNVMVLVPDSMNDNTPKPPKPAYCTFYIKFTSPLTARRCVAVLNNRYFYGRPITATYCLDLPTLKKKDDSQQGAMV